MHCRSLLELEERKMMDPHSPCRQVYLVELASSDNEPCTHSWTSYRYNKSCTDNLQLGDGWPLGASAGGREWLEDCVDTPGLSPLHGGQYSNLCRQPLVAGMDRSGHGGVVLSIGGYHC